MFITDVRLWQTNQYSLLNVKKNVVERVITIHAYLKGEYIISQIVIFFA